MRLVSDSPGDIQIIPQQTFLIDAQGQARPLLGAEQAYERIKNHLELGETFRPVTLLDAAGTKEAMCS